MKNVQNGQIIDAEETKENLVVGYRGAALNLIRQLQDRVVSSSADGGEWAEAYIDADGRLNSVDIGATTASFDTNKYKFNDTGLITHTIPTGTFKDNISTCIGVPKVVDYESGASVQYKLTNATEDSGWLDTNKVVNFTAFTSEPEQCIVKLVPKATSPTSGYPSISGFCVYGDKQ